MGIFNTNYFDNHHKNLLHRYISHNNFVKKTQNDDSLNYIEYNYQHYEKLNSSH